MPYQKRKDLVRIDEFSVAVHGTDAIAVAVRRESRVVLSLQNCFLQRRNVRFNRLGMRSAESWVPYAADFMALYSVSLKQLRQQPGRCSMHRVKCKVEFRLAKALPVHQFFEGVRIGVRRIERLDQLRAWR